MSKIVNRLSIFYFKKSCFISIYFNKIYFFIIFSVFLINTSHIFLINTLKYIVNLLSLTFSYFLCIIKTVK